MSVCILLAGADYFFKEQYKPSINDQVTEQNVTTNEGVSSSASSKNIVKKGKKIQKKTEKTLEEIAQKMRSTMTYNSEKSLLQTMLSGSTVTSAVLLQEQHRLAFLASIEHPSVREAFMKLKEQLAQNFSAQVTIITDEVQVANDVALGADILQFTDPAISTDVITLVRIRSRLYEIHTSSEQKEEIQELIDVLRQR